jgi:hypothetical protein
MVIVSKNPSGVRRGQPAESPVESAWAPAEELLVPYEAREETLYRQRDPLCRYHPVRWPFTKGRSRFGEFPLIVVREHFRSLGYVVLASEPRLPDAEGFIVVSYPVKRQKGDPAYRRMEELLGAEVIAALNVRADAAKKAATGNRGGGDPDLFAYRAGNPADGFFIEVKHHDKLTKKQLVTFPLIEEICPVVVARLVKA